MSPCTFFSGSDKNMKHTHEDQIIILQKIPYKKLITIFCLSYLFFQKSLQLYMHISNYLLLMKIWKYSLLWTHHNLLMHSPSKEYVFCFQIFWSLSTNFLVYIYISTGTFISMNSFLGWSIFTLKKFKNCCSVAFWKSNISYSNEYR